MPKSSQKSLPLKEAAWHFAPRQLRSAALEERNRPPPKTRIKRYPNFDEKVTQQLDAVEQVSDALQSFLHGNADLEEPTSEMRTLLLERLTQGKFVARGVRTRPAGEVELSLIPPQFFKGQPRIDWRRGIVENFGQAYQAVEISKTAPITKSVSTAKGKAGRPRTSGQVLKIAAELREAKQFDGRSKKEIVALVQKECRKRFPKDFPKESQPSQTSIRNVLKNLK